MSARAVKVYFITFIKYFYWVAISVPIGSAVGLVVNYLFYCTLLANCRFYYQIFFNIKMENAHRSAGDHERSLLYCKEQQEGLSYIGELSAGWLDFFLSLAILSR